MNARGFLKWCTVPVFWSLQASGTELWYQQAASSWNEALPIGNGSLGAMVFGGVAEERLQLNEKGVWKIDKYHVDKKGASYLPQIRKLLSEQKYTEAQKLAHKKLMAKRFDNGTNTYQTLGDLRLIFPSHKNVHNYRRSLDLEQAVAKVEYTLGRVKYQREYFSSFPTRSLFCRLTASKAGSLSFKVVLSRPDKGAKVVLEGNRSLLLQQQIGKRQPVRIAAFLSVADREGGTLSQNGDTLLIKNADKVTLALTAETDFAKNHEPAEACRQRIEKLRSQKYASLKSEHVQDYQYYYNKCSLELGEDAASILPTDQRIAAIRRGAKDISLYSMLFNYGRYLLISSSRKGDPLPANLQGIWADGLMPPWNADFHININIQMIYWIAELTGLSDCHEPFLNYVGKLRENGRRSAKELYNCRGFTAHHTTDASYFTTTFGFPVYGLWPMGAAWSSMHLWEHFQFTGDTTFLRSYGYTVMREAALFLSDFLTVNPDTKKLVTGPSISPENTFIAPDGKQASVCMSPAMDRQITRDLFVACIKASKLLNTDKKFRKTLQSQLQRMEKPKIGKDGRLLEWNQEFKETEPGHRHISHLYGLYPGNEFTPESTPDLVMACEKSLEKRLSSGGGHTGWSRGWIINFYARLKRQEKAHENLRLLFVESVYSNMLNAHPPFQLDGNMAAASGMVEMLIQSHSDKIEILPALPKAWKIGKVRGLGARGGFVVDIDWKENRSVSVCVQSLAGNECKLLYRGKSHAFPTIKGGSYKLTWEHGAWK